MIKIMCPICKVYYYTDDNANEKETLDTLNKHSTMHTLADIIYVIEENLVMQYKKEKLRIANGVEEITKVS